MTTKVAIVGSTGKMGRLFARLIEEWPEFELVAALDSRSELGEMLAADLVVDVTVPGVSQKIVDFAVANGRNVLVGTSGWSSDRIAALRRTLGDEPATGVVIIPNFSLGSVLATSFATMAARFYDSIEIIETHGATKVDSPSGTAVRTAELIGAARAELGPVSAPHTDQRARGQQVASIPIHSLRLNGVVARQDVIFGGTGEILTLTHETISPSAYEAGISVALRAAVSARGVTVGLDQLIDLGGGRVSGGNGNGGNGTDAWASARETDPDPENVSGQAATATSVTGVTP
jgi:4-hydroxy-tetrahydrodipicolinate reductase